MALTPHPFLVPLVMKENSYTSAPPMGRTARTEPQCLYKGDLYLSFNILPPYGCQKLLKVEWDRIWEPCNGQNLPELVRLR
jgi:hypothetical protein